MMNFSFEKDFMIINTRLDRLKQKQVRLQKGYKQTGILKIGESDFLPSIDSSSQNRKKKASTTTGATGAGFGCRRNTLTTAVGGGSSGGAQNEHRVTKVRFLLDTEGEPTV